MQQLRAKKHNSLVYIIYMYILGNTETLGTKKYETFSGHIVYKGAMDGIKEIPP